MFLNPRQPRVGVSAVQSADGSWSGSSEFGEYRCHLLGVCTAAQCRSRAVAIVCGVCHLRYCCATAVKAALGSHSMSG